MFGISNCDLFILTFAFLELSSFPVDSTLFPLTLVQFASPLCTFPSHKNSLRFVSRQTVACRTTAPHSYFLTSSSHGQPLLSCRHAPLMIVRF